MKRIRALLRVSAPWRAPQGQRWVVSSLAARKTLQEHPPLASETTLGLLELLQRPVTGTLASGPPTDVDSSKGTVGTVAAASGGLVRLVVSGSVAVGQVYEVGGELAVVLRYDRLGALAALLNPTARQIQPGTAAVQQRGLLSLNDVEALPRSSSGHVSLQDLVKTGAEVDRSLLRMPTPAPLPRRRPVQRGMPSGLTAVDTIAPLGEGQRVALVGPPGTGKSAALRMILGAQDKSTCVVYVGLNCRSVTASQLRPDGGDVHILTASPAVESAASCYLLLLAALRLALEKRRSHRHVVLAIDDLVGFADIIGRIEGPLPNTVPQIAAAALDLTGNEVGLNREELKLTTVLVLDLESKDDLPTVPRDLWRSVEPTLDRCLHFDRSLVADGVLPALDVDELFATSAFAPAYQAPLPRVLGSQLRDKLKGYRDLAHRLSTGRELGLVPELQDIEDHHSGAVVRALLTQRSALSPAEQVVIACAAIVYHFFPVSLKVQTAVASFQAVLLATLREQHPALWEALSRADDLEPKQAEAHLLQLAQVLLAHRQDFDLTRPRT